MKLNFDLIGIKQIPNVLNEGTPSEAKMTARPKPWELKKEQEGKEAVVSQTQAQAQDDKKEE